MHLSGTGFPYERGSNTYIAGHAEGYNTSRVPHVFRNLEDLRQGNHIILRDATGRTYESPRLPAPRRRPDDFWVTEPVVSRQIVSLQTCSPTPTFENRLIVRGNSSVSRTGVSVQASARTAESEARKRKIRP